MSGGCSSADAARDAEAIQYYREVAIQRDIEKAKHKAGVAERRETRKRKIIADNKAVKRHKAEVAEANRIELRAGCAACKPGVPCDNHQKSANMSKAFREKWPQLQPAAPVVLAVQPQV